MRLNRLEIAGFKSFADRSELAFDNGVTAIHLVNIEWGPITVDGNTATATTYETWSTQMAVTLWSAYPATNNSRVPRRSAS